MADALGAGAQRRTPGRAGGTVRGRGGALAFLRRNSHLLASVATGAVLVSGFQTFILAPLQGAFSGQFEDFEAYWGAATAVGGGQSPYRSFDPSTVALSGFTYPPFGALLARPLAGLDHHAAATVFLWLDLVCLIAAGVVLCRELLPATWPRARIGICAVLTFPPATYNLFHGQANPIVFLLLALALRAWVRGQQVRCGTVLGIAAAIKLAPLVLIVLLLRRHWWRGSAALAGSAAICAALGVAVVGVGPTRTWIAQVLPVLGRDNGWVYNQTWGAMFSRLAERSVLQWDPSSPVLHVAALLAAAGGMGLAALAVHPGPRPPEARGLEFGAGIAAMILAGSIAWYAHETHLLIPLLALTGFAARRPPVSGRSSAVVVVAALIVLVLVMPALIAGTTMSSLIARSGSGAGWWLYLQVWSMPGVTAVCVLLACTRVAAGPQPAALPAVTGDRAL